MVPWSHWSVSRKSIFPRRITLEWERFVDWWETLGSYPPSGTSFRTFSEEIADQIVTRWEEISAKVDKEFLKDFDNYQIAAFQDRVFVSQTRFIRKWPLPFIDALHREHFSGPKNCLGWLISIDPPNPTQGAALRYIGILGWHLVVTLEFDPQFDGIKMWVWLLIMGAEFGGCYVLFLGNEIRRSIQASLSLP